MSTAYIDGYDAYYDVDGPAACSYEPGTEDYSLWQAGYADALAEDLNA